MVLDCRSPDSDNTWNAYDRPLVNGWHGYLEKICKDFLAQQVPVTNRTESDIQDYLTGQVLCYAAHVSVFSKKFYGYWGKLTRVRFGRRKVRFDFLLEYRVIEYPSARDIPIGYLCIPPYHLASKPLYLDRFVIPRLSFRARNLTKELEPVTTPAEVIDITDSDEESSGPSTPALPVPAPVTEDGYPGGSDA